MNRSMIVGAATVLTVSLAAAAIFVVLPGANASEKELAAVGRDKANFCARCHGIAGITEIPTVPNLAGQNKEYIIKQLKDFRSGFRRSAPMREVALSLKNEEIIGLATYFNTLKRP